MMNEITSSSSTSAPSAQGPRLESGSVGYATWKPTMDVYLQRNGAEGIHRKTMTTDRWVAMSTQVEEWQSDELDAAMAFIRSPTDSASSAESASATTSTSSTTMITTVSEDFKRAQVIVTRTVERSHRVYGILFAALPVELRAQTAHIPRGFAYGLWQWLETKFQSTEEDHVGDLIETWSTLRQEVGESYDAYRARVNELRALLQAADEAPSARMYAHTLLGRLQPAYKQAVLALKVGDKLKDAKAIDWDAAAAFINAHERDQMRTGAVGASDSDHGDASRAMAAHGRTYEKPTGKSMMPSTSSAGSRETRPESTGRERDTRRCFNCDKVGHIARHCRAPRRRSPQSAGPPHSGAPGSASAAHKRSSTPSSDETALAVVEHKKVPTPNAAAMNRHTAFVATVTYAAVVKRATGQVDAAQTTQPASAGTVITTDEKVTTVAKSAGVVASDVDMDKQCLRRTLPSVAISEKDESEAPLIQTSSIALSVAVPARDDAPWGVDSMASIHLSGDKKLFTHLRRCTPTSVEVADRSIVTAVQQGSVKLRIMTPAGKSMVIPIDNVFYHERFATNLLSLGMLTDDGWKYSSEKKETILTTPGGNRIKLSTRGRVSVLDSTDSAPSDQADQKASRCSQATTAGTVFNLGPLLPVKVKTILDLHVKLGHMPFARLMRVMKTGSTLDVDKPYADEQVLRQAQKVISECQACCEGKMTRSWLGHRGLDKGNAPLEAMHMDTYFVRMANSDRKWLEYGIPLSDPYSGWRYHNWATSKDEIADGVIASIEHAKRQFNRNIKRLYTDGGTEFINRTLKEYCTKHGIELRYSPARTPQLNGVAEQSVRSCKDAVRTLLVHGRVPWRFWSYAAAHATFLWNRTHVSARTGMTPYEQLFGKAPSAKHWGVFGCDAFVHVPKEQRSSLAPKAEPCIYLGHNGRQNCANLYVLRTRKVIASRDVVYRNDSFTFSHAVCQGESAVQRAVEAAASHETEVDLRLQATTGEGDVAGSDDSLQAHRETDALPQRVNDFNASPAADGRVITAAPAHVEPAKWQLQSIAGQRWYGRQREHQFKCVWSGDYKPTWEPARIIEVDAPEAVEDFRASLPPPRQSSRTQPRVGDRAAESNPERPEADSFSVVIDGDTDGEIEPRVHMAMSAVRAMQSPSWSRADSDVSVRDFERSLACAVRDGIASLEQQTPQTYRAAVAGPDSDKWKAAMEKEIASCIAKDVWEEVRLKDLPHGTNVLPVKWVYKIKIDETGAPDIYKARLTPKGFRQKEGVDYFEVFAPTGKYKTMRFGLSVTARWDHELEQLDVPTAFLNADLEEDVYMQVPEGYRDGKNGVVLRLKKSLYGLKQAPRNWSIRLKKFIVDVLGYSSTVSDPCLFWKRSRSGRLMLLFVFVDDIQSSFHREDHQEWTHLKSQLVAEFNTKDVGTSSWMLGMRITRDRTARTITLDQEVYVTKALEKYGYAQCTTRPTPEVVGAAHQDPSQEQSQPTDRQRYMEIAGTLMYAAISTRPDIAHAVFYLASHMVAPTCLHMAAADRVMRYLAGTRSLGLIFGSRNGGLLGDSRGHSRTQVDVCAYADADWANSRGDRRSITGWVSKVNGDPISWSSKKQSTVALSTCEAELYAEAAAIQEVLWLRGLLKELGLHSQVGSIVHGDNQSAIAVTKNGIKGERTKHVDVKYHFVTETVDRGDVQLKWIPTAEQQADIFTKALPQPTFELLRTQLMATSPQ